MIYNSLTLAQQRTAFLVCLGYSRGVLYISGACGLCGYVVIIVHVLYAILPGQFLSSKVQIDTAQRQLLRQTGAPVPVKEGQVWESVKEKDYRDKLCWYPSGEESAIQGFAYEYIVEHLLATRYKFSLFKTWYVTAELLSPVL